jgi:hypothetical protein
VRLLGGGNFLETAAPLADIPIRTARHWLARGRAALKHQARHGGELTPEDALHVQFLQAVKRAYAGNQMRHVLNVTQVAMGRPARETVRETLDPDTGRVIARTVEREDGLSPQWTASAWYLERTNQKRWGKKVKVQSEHTGPNGQPLVPVEALRGVLREVDGG